MNINTFTFTQYLYTAKNKNRLVAKRNPCQTKIQTNFIAHRWHIGVKKKNCRKTKYQPNNKNAMNMNMRRRQSYKINANYFGYLDVILALVCFWWACNTCAHPFPLNFFSLLLYFCLYFNLFDLDLYLCVFRTYHGSNQKIETVRNTVIPSPITMDYHCHHKKRWPA